MNGWMFRVHRKPIDLFTPDIGDRLDGPPLAVWQADSEGLDWIDDLVGTGQVSLIWNGHGYPNRYTAPSKYICPILLAGPPHARDIWAIGEGETVVGPISRLGSRINREAIEACAPEEWLVIEVWDES